MLVVRYLAHFAPIAFNPTPRRSILPTMTDSIQPVADQATSCTTADPPTRKISPFLRLPVELRREVVNHLSRPRDLKALCLTSKEICDVATPRLYHRVDLIAKCDKNLSEEQEDELLSRVNSLLSAPSNLRFIRILNTGRFGLRTTDAIHDLLSWLREDALIEFNFSCSSAEHFPTGLQLQRLWRCQKNLQNFHLCSFHVPFLIDFSEKAQLPLSCLTKSVTRLELTYYEGELEQESAVMQFPFRTVVMSHLRHLTLNGPIPPKVVGWLNRLFAGCSFVNLKELHIDQATFTATLEPRNLPSLDIFSFGGGQEQYRNSINEMEPELPANFPLLKLRWIGVDPVYPTTLEKVLTRINGLEYLEIESFIGFERTARGRKSLAEAIESHQATLKILLIDELIKTTASAYDSQFVKRILRCKQLQVLSLPLPSNRPVAYYINIIDSLPHLVELQIYDRAGADIDGTEARSMELVKALEMYPRVKYFGFSKCLHPDGRRRSYCFVDKRRITS